MSKNKIIETRMKKHSFSKIAVSILVSISILLYALTISFEYALDDSLYITQNEFTKQGIEGISDLISKESLYGFFGEQKELVAGGRYRPLALVTWAIEYEIFSENPHISHFINLLLYGLTSFLIYYLFCRIQPSRKEAWYLGLPFIATLLFITHPLHTEVVCNIKGRVEMLGFIGVLISLLSAISFIDKSKTKYLILCGLAFFFALLGKEDSITYMAIIPLTLYYFTNANVKNQIKICTIISLSTVVFLVIRTNVLGYFLGTDIEIYELLNDPFLNASISEKYSTVFYTLGLYIKLLFIPHPLTHDYYPKQIPILGPTDYRALLSISIYVFIGLFALLGLKRKSIIAYGIWLFLIPLSLVSNLIFPIGTFMNERFMYMPSLGFCLVLVYLIKNKLPKIIPNKKYSRVITNIIMAFFIIGFATKTLIRIPAWKNNKTLFLTDVSNSPNSTKANTSAGGTLYELSFESNSDDQKRKYLQSSQEYLNKALSLHPQNTAALLLLANVHFELTKNFDDIINTYDQLFQINPNHLQGHINLRNIAQRTELNENKNKLISFYEKLLTNNRLSTSIPYEQLGVLYARHIKNLDMGIYYLEQAKSINTRDVGILQNLSIVYGLKNDFLKSIELGKKALELDPNNVNVLINLGITYANIGDKESSEYYTKKATSIDPNLK